MARSCSENCRPDCVVASVRAPNTRPRPASGATIEERTPSTRESVSSSSSGVSCCASQAVTSGMSCERPVLERRRHATRGLRPDGAARVQAAGQARGLGIRVGDAHVADLAALEHVDRAPVGEPRHRELDELGQRVLQVERLG